MRVIEKEENKKQKTEVKGLMASSHSCSLHAAGTGGGGHVTPPSKIPFAMGPPPWTTEPEREYGGMEHVLGALLP